MQGTVTAKQILQGFIALVVLIGLVWLAFYALIIVLILAAIGTVYFLVRRFLIKQGIIDSGPMDAPQNDDEADVSVTVIETEYHDVTDTSKDKDS